MPARSVTSQLAHFITTTQTRAEADARAHGFPARMMRRCRPEHEGADFTLQASAQVLLAGLVGATSGVLAQAVGYVPLFLLAGALGLAALALLRYGIPPQERRAAER